MLGEGEVMWGGGGEGEVQRMGVSELLTQVH